jgi:hypothetical protein
MSHQGVIQLINPSDIGYRFGDLCPASAQFLFDMMIDEEREMDKQFDWVLINDMVVLPVEITRIRVGDFAGSGTSYEFQYDILHEFDFDIMSLIAEKALYVKGKPNKTKQLISAILDSVTDPVDGNIEYLRNFK